NTLEAETELRPLSRDHEQRDSEFLSSVRSAIANRDQPLALQLLRQLAEQGTSAETVDYAVGDALVATARGAKQDADDRAALARLEVVTQARDQVLALLNQTPFGRADLATIRDVVEALEASMSQAEEHAAPHDGLAGASAAPLRRVGSIWLELKHIPDAASSKKWGPYLYARWRSNGRKGSKYIGKAT
ncbi:MAG: hypothetical protein LC797_23185, partial [Chloroflexi bacterium]|nr:hypothetical protein [Chloroflexota bacterium]